MITYRGILHSVITIGDRHYLTLIDPKQRYEGFEKVVHRLYSDDSAFSPIRMSSRIGWQVYGTASNDGDIQTFNVNEG